MRFANLVKVCLTVVRAATSHQDATQPDLPVVPAVASAGTVAPHTPPFYPTSGSQVAIQQASAPNVLPLRRDFPNRAAYIKAYMHARRVNFIDKVPCPACGKPKEKDANYCKPCSALHRGKYRRARRIPLQRQAPICPCCEATMRPVMWRLRAFWHCTGCGLETTPNEIRRFHEELAA